MLLKKSIVQNDLNIESYSCENCDVSFDEEDDLDTHKEGKGQDEKTSLVDDLQCDECNLVAKSKPGLKTHKTSKHMSKEKNQSLKTVTKDLNLKMKKYTFNKENIYQCIHCNLTFTDKNRLDKHERSMHRSSLVF